MLLIMWLSIMQEMDKNVAYTKTRRDPKVHVEIYKRRFPVCFFFLQVRKSIHKVVVNSHSC